MPWVTLDGKEVEGVGDVIWKGVYGDDSPVIKAVPVTDDMITLYKRAEVVPPTLEEAVKMATMDVRLDVSDFKTTLEEFQEFIHSELEAVESLYSQTKHDTDAQAVEFKHFSDNVIFLLKKIEDAHDQEVADRMELAIRVENRMSNLEAMIVGMIGELDKEKGEL